MSITWNGISSDSIGVIVEKVPNRYVPTRRFSPQQVAGRNGNILLVDKSFPNVEQEYEVYLSAENRGIPAVARACAEWLMAPAGYATLTDSYDTTVYREAFLMGGFDIENILNKFGKCSISFSCKPQKYLITDETLVAHNPEIYSGVVANFTAKADDEITSLTASITPVQSGSGDPSPDNVRPITGGTGANIVRTGKNLLKNRLSGSGEKNSLTYVVNADGSITVNGTADGTSTLPDILHPADTEKVPAGSYILSGCPEGGASNTYRLVLKKGTTYYTDTGSGAAFTINRGENYEIYIRYNSGAVFNNLTFKPMIRLATETDDTYEPYAGETYSADWTSAAGTVYAGSYDAVSGKLKARPQYASYNGETLVGPWLSSMDVYEEGATPTTGAQVVDLGGAETEYTLTGQTVSPIVGHNYVWADTGDVSVAVYGYINTSITNPTPFDARPIITVSGAGTVTINGYEIEILESVSDFTINCETMEADDNKKISCLEFPVLSGGSNTVTCDAGITSISMVPRWWTL